jgi:hypothetical protein
MIGRRISLKCIVYIIQVIYFSVFKEGQMSEINSVSPKTPVFVPQTSGKATASLIFGILGFLFLPIIGGIVAVACGYPARKEIRKSGGRLTGDGMATGGIILGWINIGLFSLIGCVLFVIPAIMYMGVLY